MSWGTNLLSGLFGALFGDEDIFSDDSKNADAQFGGRKPGSSTYTGSGSSSKAQSFRYDPLEDDDIPEGQYTTEKNNKSSKYSQGSSNQYSKKYSNNTDSKSYSSNKTRSNYYSYDKNNSQSDNSSEGFKYYDASDDTNRTYYSNNESSKSWNTSSKQTYGKDQSASASQGFRRQHATKSKPGSFSYPTLSSKSSNTVKNDRASFTFGTPHFSTYDHGVRGIAFPYTLKVNNPYNRKIVVSGKFCNNTGSWIKSLVPDMADRYGDLVINESVICIDHKFNVDSYLFLPYGVLALKNTQKIYFNIDVFVDGEGPQHLLRYVHGFEYYIYENDPREPQQFSSSTSSSTPNMSNNQVGFEELIGLVAHVIKADGVCAPEEIRVVIDHFKNFKNLDKDLLKDKLKYKLANPSKIEDDCAVLKRSFNTQTKLTFIALFIKIAISDEAIPNAEMELVEKISTLMGIPKSNYDKIVAEFLPASDKVWHIFGLTSKATKEQLKKAYRQKCKEWHPDRFANAPKEEYKKAEEKFKELQDFYSFLLRKY